MFPYCKIKSRIHLMTKVKYKYTNRLHNRVRCTSVSLIKRFSALIITLPTTCVPNTLGQLGNSAHKSVGIMKLVSIQS